SLSEIGQLLWAAQGITSDRGFRTAPSAGALYPLELYLVVGDVEQLSPSVYKYQHDMHRLINIAQGDLRDELQAASLDQSAIGDAPAVIVIAAVYERTTVKYGDRGNRYVHMEVGSAAQNVYLQAVSLDLGTVFIGAFHDQNINSLLHMQEDEHPLAIMPVGRK
ncbi:MAG: SagB/ThcOx family dehydrogenase, partial [Chloroflexota bacterium]|nr:SagB/ThcOx family dehydrogenase [Chloroflexota bacterium]